MTHLPLDEGMMRAAIAASNDARLAGDLPFGATLSKDGALLHVSRNTQITSSDVTAHAELVLVREMNRRRELLRGATVYASGEPCAMCAGALFWAGVTRIVFAASTDDIQAALGDPALPIRAASVLAQARPAVQVDGPLLRDDAVAVLRAFARAPRFVR